MRDRGTPSYAWPVVFGLSVFALAAIAIAAFMLASGRADPVLSAGAILLLSVGQVAVIVTFALRQSGLDSRASAMSDALHRLIERSDSTDSRLAEAERLARDNGRSKLEALASDVRALHEVVRALMDRIRGGERQPAGTGGDIQWAAGRSPRTPASAPPDPPEDQRLDLLLEPVIELATGATAHYRALLDLSGGKGQVVQHAELMRKADAGGMRPALDAHMLRQVVPVLRRLRARNPGMRAFVPIGTATLQSRDDLARITGLLETEADVARGIVFELTHGELGQLDDAAIDGLARLGRAGATLALAEVQVAGLDLAALRQLGVRYLSFPPSAADSGFGPTPAWREFVQYARAMQFQITIADVQSSPQAEAAARIGRYAFGPFYAPPRKVRADAGLPAASQRAAAA